MPSYRGIFSKARKWGRNKARRSSFGQYLRAGRSRAKVGRKLDRLARFGVAGASQARAYTRGSGQYNRLSRFRKKARNRALGIAGGAAGGAFVFSRFRKRRRKRR